MGAEDRLDQWLMQERTVELGARALGPDLEPGHPKGRRDLPLGPAQEGACPPRDAGVRSQGAYDQEALGSRGVTPPAASWDWLGVGGP